LCRKYEVVLNQVTAERKEVMAEKVILSNTLQSSRYKKQKINEINSPIPKRTEAFVVFINV